MRLTIDNLDGKGAVDYSDQLVPEGPITIRRELNKPSTLTCEMLILSGDEPSRLGRVVVSRGDSLVLFTGYLSRVPESIYAGEASAGSIYRLRVSAISDEWLLDKQGLSRGGESYTLSGDELLESLTKRIDSNDSRQRLARRF